MEEKFTKCAVCGKRFYVQEYGLYKWRYDGKICCSYTCMRVLEKEADKKRINWIKKTMKIIIIQNLMKIF